MKLPSASRFPLFEVSPNPLLPGGRDSHHAGLRLIAAFKLVKGLLLLGVGLGAFSLLHKNIAETLHHWVAVLRADPDNRYLHGLLAWLELADDRTLAEISAGTFFYSALLSTEGVGLWFEKRWAEYLTVVFTGSFIPLEVWELTRHVSTAKIVVIAINVAVVWYLVVTLVRERPRRADGARTVDSPSPSS